MKNKCLLLAMLLALLCLTQSCSDENNSPRVQKKVQFSLGLRSPGSATGRMQDTIPEGASVLITITTPDGGPVYTHKLVNLYHLGDGYVTEPLLLEPGDYTLTDFWVMKDSSVVYLTPQAGSPLANAVSRPLPIDFTVSADAVADVAIEVVNPEGHSAEDFGYVSFDLTVVDVPDTDVFRVSVFVEEDGHLTLTDAYIRFYPNDPFYPVYEHDLQAVVNTLDLSAVDYEYDILISIEKPGYQTYRQWMSNADVRNAFRNTPLQVTLTPLLGGTAFELEFAPYTQVSSYFTLTAEGEGTLSVDWGDGFRQNLFIGTGNVTFAHDYNELTPRPIRITGDLDHIVGFWGHAPLTSLQTGVLTSLRSVSIYEGDGNSGMSTYDFTQNTLLESISFALGGGEILLPPTHNVNHVELNYFGTNLEALVTNIYNNAVSKNIRNGHFYHDYWGPGTVPPQVVPLLNSLRDDYGWNVSYYE